MEEDKKLEKRKNIEIVVLSIIIVALLGALIYLLFIKKDKPTEPLKRQDNQQMENNNNNELQENTKYTLYSFDEVVTNMKKNLYFDYEITSDKLPRELEINENYHIVLSSEGKVTIQKGEDNAVALSNISNAKNIDYCNDMYIRLYILLNNGDVYEYTLEDFDNNRYEAKKINDIKDATKFVKLQWADCTECGGNTNLGIIDKNNMYIELDSVSY